MSFKRDGDDQSWLNTLKRRRVSELFAVNIPEDEAYLMKNGRFACLVCYHRPVFDTINSLAVHRSGRKHATYVEEFLSKKTELNNLRLKRQQELYISSGQVPVIPQQTKPAVHKLLGARMYDSRSKRPKLKATDRRPTLDMNATQDDELTSNSYVKPPQTVDEMRRLRNRRMQNAQQVIKPYIGKRAAVAEQGGDVSETRRASEHDATAVAANALTSCSVSASDSSSSCDATDTTVHVRSVTCRGTGCSLNVKASKCQDTETRHLANKSCLRKEKLEQYLQAVGSGWKRSRDGSWVKDENAEFDSDEDAPDI